MMRVNKYLALCGLGSRRKCEALVQSKQVAVNDVIIESLSFIINENHDRVTVSGRRVFPPEKFIYILLNKPAGYVTTASDELGRKTVLDLLPDFSSRVFPVGRLDKDTTGALILTNDGDLAYQLTHPKYDVDKVYNVLLDKNISREHVRKLENGIMLEEGMTRQCRIKVAGNKNSEIEIILHEGKKRQIRRMVEALGYRVVQLNRVKFGFLEISKMKCGQWRYLTEMEVGKLKRMAVGDSQDG